MVREYSGFTQSSQACLEHFSVYVFAKASAGGKTVFSHVVVLRLDRSSFICRPEQQWSSCPCSFPVWSHGGSPFPLCWHFCVWICSGKQKMEMTWLKVHQSIHPSIQWGSVSVLLKGQQAVEQNLMGSHRNSQFGFAPGTCPQLQCCDGFVRAILQNLSRLPETAKDSQVVLTLYGWIFF